MPTRALTIATTVVVTVLVVVGLAGSAHAAAYRYWTYWQGGTDSWAFATAGPASTVPADGSVEGWRFAVTTAVGGASDAPVIPASFASICGGTPAQADRKRVALVIDSGTTATAPTGQAPPPAAATCVIAEPDATGYQILRSVATVRTDGGLICAIDDYPAGECAPVVDLPVPSASQSASQSASAGADSSPVPATAAPDPSSPVSAMDPAGESSGAGSPGAPWVTAAVVALVAVVGLVVWRRRRE